MTEEFELRNPVIKQTFWGKKRSLYRSRTRHYVGLQRYWVDFWLKSPASTTRFRQTCGTDTLVVTRPSEM